MKRSIEVEYWVVDQDGALTTPGPLTEVSEFVEEEFVEPLFELKTPPCETHADLRRTFVDQLDTVVSRADALDKLLVPLGTPLNCGPIDQLPGERARIQRRVVGRNFDYAKHCAGTHFHFEKRNVTGQLNALTALDPALALLNSSPYYRGHRIADSARTYLYRQKCYEHLPNHGQLWDYVDSVSEWERRLDRRFEEFKAAAIAAGVDEDDVDGHFTACTAVWSPVRLREEMPTVEWRSPASALPSEILRLNRDVGRVVDRLDDTPPRIDGTRGRVTNDSITLPEFETVSELSRTAVNEGLRSPDVVAYLDRMGFDVDEYDPTARTIGHRDYVSPSDARKIRLRYGKLLRRDVNDLTRDGRETATPLTSASTRSV